MTESKPPRRAGGAAEVNARIAPDSKDLARWSNLKLVQDFKSACISHCEMDNTSTVEALRMELLRRLNKRAARSAEGRND